PPARAAREPTRDSEGTREHAQRHTSDAVAQQAALAPPGGGAGQDGGAVGPGLLPALAGLPERPTRLFQPRAPRPGVRLQAEPAPDNRGRRAGPPGAADAGQ